jgi:hypothetical protein
VTNTQAYYGSDYGRKKFAGKASSLQLSPV